eukprot:m.308193 g.308193  ORF g.308193 m.308193 type:complete len:255 (+) comp43544_c0_seq1:216-980(+)
MKLLENAQLDALTQRLSIETAGVRISGRVESYSCKMIDSDKRLYRMLSQENQGDVLALSPPKAFWGATSSPSSCPPSISPLANTCSRKMISYLISTLNASFQPDYDFSDARSDEFSKEPSAQFVANAVRSCLGSTVPEAYNRFESSLWSAIDEQIDLSEASIYSYNPDLTSDPYGEEGSLWSFNYFFYNHKRNRMLFFTCQAVSSFAPSFAPDEADAMETMCFMEDMDDSGIDVEKGVAMSGDTFSKYGPPLTN